MCVCVDEPVHRARVLQHVKGFFFCVCVLFCVRWDFMAGCLALET